jgi:hypothetical protein
MGVVTAMGIRSFDIIKAAIPEGYVAVHAPSAGRTSATRYEIYHGPALHENWIGDVVYWIPENKWDAQPKAGALTTHRFAVNAVRELITMEAQWKCL